MLVLTIKINGTIMIGDMGIVVVEIKILGTRGRVVILTSNGFVLPEKALRGLAKGEKIQLSESVIVTVNWIRGIRVSLGINAPPNVPVHRKEVHERILAS